MTIEMLTVASITAHGHQCKIVGLHLQFRRMGMEIKMVLSRAQTKTNVHVPDIPHTLSSIFVNVSSLKLCQLMYILP